MLAPLRAPVLHQELSQHRGTTPTYWCGMGAARTAFTWGRSARSASAPAAKHRACSSGLCRAEPGHSNPPVLHGLPVIVHELAAFDVWHGDNTTALVLAIPDRAGNLQHSQDSAIPAQGNRTSVPPPNIGICLTGPLCSACQDPSPCRLAQLLAVQRSKNYSSCSLLFTKKKK